MRDLLTAAFLLGVFAIWFGLGEIALAVAVQAGVLSLGAIAVFLDAVLFVVLTATFIVRSRLRYPRKFHADATATTS